MERQNLLATLLTTFAVVIATTADGNWKAANANNLRTSSMTIASKSAATLVLASGNFIKSEHPTSGTAQIVVQNGKKYVKFDSTFQTEDGPDLFVLLHRQGSPARYNNADYISLGRLKKVNGQQMYHIPDGVDVTRFKSVVIWCRQFNATFGFAPLS
jgi:hypothetical protein